MPPIGRRSVIRGAGALAASGVARPSLAEEQKRKAEALQLECFNSVPQAPCGVTLQPAAWRADLEGVLGGVPKFWNVRRRA